MTDENFKIKLNKELDILGGNFIILLSTNSKDYFNSVLETLKFLTDRGMSGVYLTSARPYDYMMKNFEKYNINTENLFFIDTVSCMAGKFPGEHENCVFIENPTSLEEIGMWTDTLMKRLKIENKFLILDSLSTMLIYNDATSLKKFGQLLINRLRLHESSGIFTSIDMEIQGGLYEALSALCDKTIKI